MLTIQGFVARGFERVRDAFASNFEHHGDVGVACAVYRAGYPVVDVWAGFVDVRSGRPWESDTVQLVFSATKGVSATCANLKFNPTADERTRGLGTAVYGSL
jgi:CubicO group peptidase (beta-lactamase class C family)